MTKPHKPEQTARIEGGEVLASIEDRTITGLLLPYGELGRTNLGMFQVEAGAVKLPTDLDTMNALNTDHVREAGIGRPTRVWEQPEGVMASFRIAEGPEGDAVLADARSENGKRKRLSAEFGPAVIQAGKLVAGHAKLWGAALVPKGAFPSAMVLAADTESHYESSYTDENGVTWQRVEDTTTETEETENGTKTTEVTTVVTEETTAAEADPTEEEESAVSVPNVLAGEANKTTETEPETTMSQVFAAIADAKRTGGRDENAMNVLAALADIKISGANTITVGGKVIKPNFVGKLWQGKEYQRKFIGLANHGTDISAAGKEGYTLHRGTEAAPAESLGGDWAGNKTEVPTGNAFTKSATSTLDRFAFGADIAREFYDLPGGAPVVEAFLKLVVEDYAKWSDRKALAFIRQVAGAAIAPKAYPSVAGHDYPAALGHVIQGILAVTDADDTPSYSIVNPVAYEQLIYTPKDLLAEFVSLTVNTEGSGTADGKVQIVKAPDSFFTGLDPLKPAAITGAKNAIEFDELSATPLEIEALEIAKGGIDKALHGYLQKFQVRAEGVVVVGTAKA